MESEAAAAALPSLAEALGWVGFELDDAGGRAVGRVEGVYADAEGGGPVWLVVALGRQGARRIESGDRGARRAGFVRRGARRIGFGDRGARRIGFGRRGAKQVAVPLRECAAVPGRVWTAQGREAIGNAPAVDPSRPLLREHEAAICAHYGIGEQVGRHAEVGRRPSGAVTTHPVS